MAVIHDSLEALPSDARPRGLSLPAAIGVSLVLLIVVGGWSVVLAGALEWLAGRATR